MRGIVRATGEYATRRKRHLLRLNEARATRYYLCIIAGRIAAVPRQLGFAPLLGIARNFTTAAECSHSPAPPPFYFFFFFYWTFYHTRLTVVPHASREFAMRANYSNCAGKMYDVPKVHVFFISFRSKLVEIQRFRVDANFGLSKFHLQISRFAASPRRDYNARETIVCRNYK